MPLCRGQRHRQGAVPNEESQSPFLYVSPRAEGQSVHQDHSLFTTPGTEQPKQNCYVQAWPPVGLHSVYLMSPHVTKSPRPSPSVFAYCKQQRLEVGTAWDRGYFQPACVSRSQYTFQLLVVGQAVILIFRGRKLCSVCAQDISKHSCCINGTHVIMQPNVLVIKQSLYSYCF